MSRDAVKTLFHPFATGTIELPGEGASVLFLGAEAGFDLPKGFAGKLHAVQGFRPAFRQLEALGLDPSAFAEGDSHDLALVLMTRHRGENEAMVAEAVSRLKPGSLIIVAGAKEDGVQSFRKRLAAMGMEIEHLAKYHAQAFWFVRPHDTKSISDAFTPKPVIVENRFRTAPGMFSHQEVDNGSAFLARYLPKGAKGQAADFAAGWGYLSVMLAEVSPEIEEIDLYEADHASLEAARANMKSNCPKMQTRLFWHDLVHEDVRGRYDLIIMNPPFHEGHASEPSIGQAMIRAASKAVKNGGQLLMVANRGLAYEPVLAEAFKSSGETARNARYKVLWGKK